MTIHQLRKPCFILDPSPWDDDHGEPHYATWHEADEALRELREERGPSPEDLAALEPVRVKHNPGPCWVAECDSPGCGDQYEDDDAGGSHFDSAGTLMRWMRQDGWTTADPDGAICWTHSPADAALPPPSPAELEAAGQLVLPGVA